MPVSFTAIDFETANGSPASACAVGLVRVDDGRVTARDGWLIKPPPGHDEFRPFNVELHGISRERVARARTWREQLPSLLSFAHGTTLVAHFAQFDLGVIAAASRATGAHLPPLPYFCSLRTARRVYELASYRLPFAARAAGFTTLVHHDPLSDAEACAAIVLDAARRTGADSIGELAETLGDRVRELCLTSDPSGADELVRRATFD